ncbi:Hypothetical predicted protein [Olea europaea subsp. europaea]|uniref:Uncharacterized protein n=1 Tax=Olea europaea subsp. europaea TaxID=158383 RepID=A0A8S0USQ6_OLEEU|nr:Hypothetical predicted protein [Olea europaea subsp. europaea]
MDDHSQEEWRGMKPEIAKSLSRSTSEEEELFDAVKLLLSLGNRDFGPQPRNDLEGKVDKDEVMTSDSLTHAEIDEINLLLALKNKKSRFPGKNLTICEKAHLDSNNFEMIDEQSSNAKNQFEENKVQVGHKRFHSTCPMADEVPSADEDTKTKHKVLGKAPRYPSSFH